MASTGVWKQSLLKDFFWFQEGPGVRKWQFKDTGVKLLNVANIEKSRTLNLDKTDRHLDSEEVRSRYSHFLIDAGDLVIASSGISFDDDGMLRTRGAFVEEQHLPLCLNTSTIRFKAKPELSDLRYLQHWLDSREFREQITRLVTGSAQQNFGPSHLSAIKISLPPLPEQIRIAAILDQADALRVKRREALAQLDSLTQAIFIDMFGDLLDQSSQWQSQPISNFVAGFESGKSVAADDEDDTTSPFRVLKVSAVTSLEYRPQESKAAPTGYTPKKTYFVNNGDLLFSRANTTELIGATAYVSHTPPNLLLSDKLWRFVWHETPRAELFFVAYLFRQPKFRAEIGRRASGTSGSMKNISQEKVLSISVGLPPLELQQTFANRVRCIEKVKTASRASEVELNALFASLQHRAFRGEL